MQRRDDADHDLPSPPDIELDGLQSSTILLSALERQQNSVPSITSSQPPPPRHRTAYLDGLRGVGALMVYSTHHIPWFYGGDNALENGFGYHGSYCFGQLPYVRLMFTGGNAAVAIFFVLSGYCLSVGPLRLLAHQDGGGNGGNLIRSLKSAVVRRPFRLFIPAIGISLGFAVMMQLPLAMRPKTHWPESLPSFGAEMGRWVRETAYVVNPFVRHGVFESWYPYDPPVYTTAMEFQGSLLLFTIFGIFNFIPTITPRGATLGLALIGAVLLFTYQWAPAAFMFGAVLAANDLDGYDISILKSLSLSAKSKSILHHCALLSGGYILSQPTGEMKDPDRSRGTFGWYYLTQSTPSIYLRNNEWWRFWNVTGATFLVYSLLRLSWLQRLLLRPVIRHLGRISFSLYLIHAPIMWTAGDRVYRFFGTIRWPQVTTWFDRRFPVPDMGPMGLTTRYLAAQVVVLPMTLVAAELATRWLDEPGVRFSRWLSVRLGLDKERKRDVGAFGNGVTGLG